jgi:G:T-mismatch repair DNA endonuclease (very short patch repair protein)
MWQPEHGAVGTVVKLFALGAYGGLWHWAQGAVACVPASAKNVEWLKAVARSQVVSEFLWQLSHVVGSPVWFTGVRTPVMSFWWQPTHVVGTVVVLFAEGAYGGLWHTVHCVVAWTPTSGNVVWLNDARYHVASVNLWHESHVVGKFDPMWSTGDFALL